MLVINDTILAKDFNGEIKVDDINIWNQDTNQFSLYSLIDCSEDIKEKLDISSRFPENQALLVFPFQCGIQFAPGYHLLNIRDCLGVTTITELQKAWKKEL